MKNKKMVGSFLIALTTLGTSWALAADNGITKEDIKQLQVNAYTEEMQKEMEKSVRSDLNSSLKTSDFKVAADAPASVADEKIVLEAPAITSR